MIDIWETGFDTRPQIVVRQHQLCCCRARVGLDLHQLDRSLRDVHGCPSLAVYDLGIRKLNPKESRQLEGVFIFQTEDDNPFPREKKRGIIAESRCLAVVTRPHSQTLSFLGHPLPQTIPRI